MYVVVKKKHNKKLNNEEKMELLKKYADPLMYCEALYCHSLMTDNKEEQIKARKMYLKIVDPYDLLVPLLSSSWARIIRKNCFNAFKEEEMICADRYITIDILRQNGEFEKALQIIDYVKENMDSSKTESEKRPYLKYLSLEEELIKEGRADRV